MNGGVQSVFMYRGDLGRVADETVDLSVPLLITSAGNIRPRTVPRFYTNRPKGQADYQLIYVSNGCVHFTMDGKEQVVDKGHMVLFRPHEPQIYEVYPKEQGEFFWVHFTGSDVEAMLVDCGIPPAGNVFWVGNTSDIRSMYCQMIRELQLKGTHYGELLQMNLRHLLLLINRHLTDTPNEDVPFQGEIIQALGWFERHWREPISMDEYAVRNRMTPYWFRQKFKAFTGTTPTQYVISLRIANAMNLMENTDYNIEQIAEAVGYDNPSYFRRLFRKHTGLSPSEYKQRHKA